MDYLKWLAYAVQAVSIGLIFAAFVPLRSRLQDEKGKMYFRPWLLAYGLVVFVIWSLFDVVLKMHLLD